MFHDAPGSGSLVLAWSASHLRAHDFELYDIQMLSPHLERLGAIEITADDYQERLAAALAPRPYETFGDRHRLPFPAQIGHRSRAALGTSLAGGLVGIERSARGLTGFA